MEAVKLPKRRNNISHLKEECSGISELMQRIIPAQSSIHLIIYSARGRRLWEEAEPAEGATREKRQIPHRTDWNQDLTGSSSANDTAVLLWENPLKGKMEESFPSPKSQSAAERANVLANRVKD